MSRTERVKRLNTWVIRGLMAWGHKPTQGIRSGCLNVQKSCSLLSSAAVHLGSVWDNRHNSLPNQRVSGARARQNMFSKLQWKCKGKKLFRNMRSCYRGLCFKQRSPEEYFASADLVRSALSNGTRVGPLVHQRYFHPFIILYMPSNSKINGNYISLLFITSKVRLAQVCDVELYPDSRTTILYDPGQLKRTEKQQRNWPGKRSNRGSLNCSKRLERNLQKNCSQPRIK